MPPPWSLYSWCLGSPQLLGFHPLSCTYRHRALDSTFTHNLTMLHIQYIGTFTPHFTRKNAYMHIALHTAHVENKEIFRWNFNI